LNVTRGPMKGVPCSIGEFFFPAVPLLRFFLMEARRLTEVSEGSSSFRRVLMVSERPSKSFFSSHVSISYVYAKSFFALYPPRKAFFPTRRQETKRMIFRVARGSPFLSPTISLAVSRPIDGQPTSFPPRSFCATVSRALVSIPPLLLETKRHPTAPLSRARLIAGLFLTNPSFLRRSLFFFFFDEFSPREFFFRLFELTLPFRQLAWVPKRNSLFLRRRPVADHTP